MTELDRLLESDLNDISELFAIERKKMKEKASCSKEQFETLAWEEEELIKQFNLAFDLMIAELNSCENSKPMNQRDT
jgi:hypothetical protein